MIAEWDRKKKELDDKFEHRKQIGAEEVQPWDPTKPKSNLNQEMEEGKSNFDEEIEESSELMEINQRIAEIDQMEQVYLKEYYALVEKDKEEGKDFNRLRHDSMVNAQLDFAYERKLEQAEIERTKRKQNESGIKPAKINQEDKKVED